MTTRYVEYGKKARLDVVDRGHTDENKSENQKEWEDHLYLEFKDVLETAELRCPKEKPSLETPSLKKLQCSNTKYYFVYDALEEQQELSQAVDRSRLKKDCGSDAWTALSSPYVKLDLEAREQFKALETARDFSVSAMASCSDISFLDYVKQEVFGR